MLFRFVPWIFVKTKKKKTLSRKRRVVTRTVVLGRDALEGTRLVSRYEGQYHRASVRHRAGGVRGGQDHEEVHDVALVCDVFQQKLERVFAVWCVLHGREKHARWHGFRGRLRVRGRATRNTRRVLRVSLG